MIDRHARALIDESMKFMRVTAVIGARQVGKTTLVRQVVDARDDATFVSLDDEATRQAAVDDPAGFIARLKPLVAIDEVQRAPGLMLAIKMQVDQDNSPGQFLLTGSSNLLLTSTIPDALPGRTLYVDMFPFTQAEIAGNRSQLLGQLFDGEFPRTSDHETSVEGYLPRIVTGGYPAVQSATDRARDRFFSGYLRSVLNHDVDDIARVDSHPALIQVLRSVAQRSGSALNYAALAREASIDAKTSRRYLELLETMFMINRLPAWSRNVAKRQARMPKATVADTGLMAHLLNVNRTKLTRSSQTRALGLMFEAFGINEVLRLINLESSVIRPFHFRDRDDREIDLLLEKNDGSLVGFEFKASSTVRPSDFRHLKYLKQQVGDQLIASVVVYAGKASVPFGTDRFAIPLGALWQ